MQVKSSRGCDIRLSGPPEQIIHAGPVVRSAALLGADYPGMRPRLAVAEGDQVRIGQMLLTDRKWTEIAFVSPLAGVVAAIERGPRGTLSALVIHQDAVDASADAEPVCRATGQEVRQTLLARGLWPAFLTRPFGRVPAPDAKPDAIFVTATDTNPLAADPRVVLESQLAMFRRGVELLTMLTDKQVYVCQSPGADLVERSDRVRTVSFSGPHPSGLAGTHVHRLHPLGMGEQVWTIGCQDVAAIGDLFETGCYRPERVIALAGPHIGRPRLIRTVLGANIDDLTKGEKTRAEGSAKVLSGSVLAGRDATYLGRHHWQVSAVDSSPIVRKPSLLERLNARRASRSPRPLIPTEALEGVLPAGLLPVPLMRALSVGDAEAAQRLGCLSLVEEDLALLSCLCTSGADYGALLRDVLDELAEAA